MAAAGASGDMMSSAGSPDRRKHDEGEGDDQQDRQHGAGEADGDETQHQARPRDDRST